MDSNWKTVLWPQFGAAIDMLENAIDACPEALWGDRSLKPEFWYVAFHALFFLDFYLADSPAGFAPPPPFTLSELDPAGTLPERPYTREEIGTFLQHGRAKARRAIDGLSEERARQLTPFLNGDLTALELVLYGMRHVQHHAAQLNLLLRQNTDSAPEWVRWAGDRR
ncbi:MAG: DinB family protein [Acidobacteriota bacterium]